MKKLKILLIILASSGCAFAQSLEEQFKSADAELNRVYKDLRSQLNEQQKAELKKSQLAWIKEKDRLAKQASTSDQRQQILTQIIIERTLTLREASAKISPARANQNAKSTFSIEADFHAADAELNNVYQKLQANLNQQQKLELKKSQIYWINQKEESTKNILDQNQKHQMLLNITRQRTNELNAHLEKKSFSNTESTHQEYVKNQELMSLNYNDLANMLDDNLKFQLEKSQKSWIESQRFTKDISHLINETKNRTDILSQLLFYYKKPRFLKLNDEHASVNIFDFIRSISNILHSDFERLKAIKDEHKFWFNYLNLKIAISDKKRLLSDFNHFEDSIKDASNDKEAYQHYKHNIDWIIKNSQTTQKSILLSNEIKAKVNTKSEDFASISDDARLIVTAGNNLIQLWNFNTGLVIERFPFKETICGIQFDLSGNSVYVAHYEGAEKYESGVMLSRLILSTGELLPIFRMGHSWRTLGTLPTVFINPVTGKCNVIYHDDHEIACKQFNFTYENANIICNPSNNPNFPEQDKHKNKPTNLCLDPLNNSFGNKDVDKYIYYLGASDLPFFSDKHILKQSPTCTINLDGNLQKGIIINISSNGAILRMENGVNIGVNIVNNKITHLGKHAPRFPKAEYIKYNSLSDSLIIGDYNESTEFKEYDSQAVFGRQFKFCAEIALDSAKYNIQNLLLNNPQILTRDNCPESLPKNCLHAILFEQKQTYSEHVGVWQGQKENLQFGQNPEYFISKSQFIARDIHGKDSDYYGIQDMTYWPKVTWAPSGEALYFYGPRYKGRLGIAAFYKVSFNGKKIALEPIEYIDGPRKSDHWLRDKNRWLEEVKKTTTNHRNES